MKVKREREKKYKRRRNHVGSDIRDMSLKKFLQYIKQINRRVSIFLFFTKDVLVIENKKKEKN